MFSYTQGGLPTKKRIVVTMLDSSGTPTFSNYTEALYTYDTEGRRTQMVYPKGRYYSGGWSQDPSRTLDYTYDSMGRANTMSEPSPFVSWVGSVSYNAASQPTAIGGETRTYNILGQLTQLTKSTQFSERYDYHAIQNNGRITGKKNLLSGEEVQYTYDSLQRLSLAITVTDPLVTQWGQNFTYDGWGNLLGASVAKGSAPTFSVTVNGLTNRINGTTYDANGNQGSAGQYDVENRLAYYNDTSGKPIHYGYDGGNKRVMKSTGLGVDGSGNPIGTETLMFYGVGGERLAEFTLTMPVTPPSGWYLRFAETKTLVWFGSKLLRDGKYAVVQDRLGSVRWRYDTVAGTSSAADYYPYGQEKPSATVDDREKFATYLRDAESGLDYADQRYHQPGWGRFMSPDPYQASAGAGQPGSWNRYAYVEGDPANHIDPRGLFIAVPPAPMPPPPPPLPEPYDPQPASPGQIIPVPADPKNQQVEEDHKTKQRVLMEQSIARVRKAMTTDCARAIGANSVGDALNKLGVSMVIADLGALQYQTNLKGEIEGLRTSPPVARYRPGGPLNAGALIGQGEQIAFNNGVNWEDPTQTVALVDGKPMMVDLLAATAHQLTVGSVSADQFFDLVVLHELAHAFKWDHDNPRSKNYQDLEAYDQSIWRGCIK